MNNKNIHCSLITCIKVRNRRFLFLVKELRNIFDPYSISGFPKDIENTIFRNTDLAKKLGISHLWIFSQENVFCFLSLIKTGFGPFISFRVLNFSLRNEMNIFFDEKKLKNYSPILLLNNFYSENKNILVLKETLRKIFPIEESQQILVKKFLKIILFDFDSDLNMIAFRCYKIKGNLILFPRKLRRQKKLKKKPKILKENTPIWTKEEKSQIVNKKPILNLIRVEEIGPKFSATLCEIFHKF